MPTRPSSPRSATRAIVRFGSADGYVRLIVTRGPGKLGVSAHTCGRPTVILIVASSSCTRPSSTSAGSTSSPRACAAPRADSVPPQIKSLNYLTSVLAVAEARSRGAHEALLLNAAGEIAECTADNVFLVSRGRVTSPRPSPTAVSRESRAAT